MGIYSHLINTLPRHPGVEPERRDIVERMKELVLKPLMDGEEPITDPVGDVDGLLEEAETLVRGARQILSRSCAGKRHAGEFGRAYAQARAMKARVEQLASEVGILVEALQWLMIEQAEVEGLTSMRLATGQSIVTYKEPYAQVENPDALRKWAIENGYENKLTLLWQVTNAITKERLLAGEPEPDGVKCYAKDKVRLTGA